MSLTKKLIRKKFRDSVFTRDGYKCRCCGRKGFDRQGGDNHLKFHKTSLDLVELDAHHITNRTNFLNGGYVTNNGISVCPTCHEKAEIFPHPNDFYKLIGSTLEQAQKDDARNK